MKTNIQVRGALFTLLAAIVLILCATGVSAQTGRIVLQKGNAKIYQQADGWQIYHGNTIVAHGEGSLNVGNLPPMFKVIFDDIASTSLDVNLGKSLSKASTATYGPYITTVWNQDGPYNDVFPLLTYTDSNGAQKTERTITGCSTIATAQLLYFYGYCNPISASGTKYTSFTNIQPDDDSYSITNFRQDPTDAKYHIYDYSIEYTPDFQKIKTDTRERSRFLMAVSMAQKAGYGIAEITGGTATSNVAQKDALKDIFGYNVTEYSGLTSLANSNVDNALKSGQPLIINGTGHSFMIDGYKSDEYHIDYGWGGASNCWMTAAAFAQSKYGSNFDIFVATPKIAVPMQQTPKYLHVTTNDTDRKIDMRLISGTEYSAQVTLDGGIHEISIEYADGTIVAPYTTQTLQLSPLNPKYTKKGLMVATPTQLELPSRYTIEVRHNIVNAEISIEATDLAIKISGHVYAVKSGVPNAWVTTVPVQPVEKEINNGFNSSKGFYLFYGARKIEFTPDESYITKAGIYLYGGNKKDLLVSVIDSHGNTAWEGVVPGSQIVSSGWTTIDFGGSVKVVAGEKNTLSIAYATEPSSYTEMYYHGQNDKGEFAYKITTCNIPVTRTNDDGAYTITVGNPFSGALYTYHPITPEFAPLYLANVNADLTGQDINTTTTATFATISGKVIDGNSNPVPYASISTTSNFAANSTIKAAYDGSYTIKVDKNFSGKIYATAQNYGSANISVSNTTGYVTGKDIKITNNMVTITGRILSVDNEVIPSALVSLSADMSNPVKTAANGSFSIPASTNSNVKLYVKTDGCDFTPKDVKTATTDIAGIQIQELPKNVTISGRVLDADSKPMADVFINTTSQKPQEKLDVDVTKGTITNTYFGESTDFTFTPTQKFITRMSVEISKQGNPGNITATIADMQGNTVWTRTFAQSEFTKEFDVNASVTPNATYRMTLTYNQPSGYDFYFYSKSDQSNSKPLHRAYTADAITITNANGEYSIQVRRHSNLTLYAFSDNDEYDPLTIADAANDLANQNFKGQSNTSVKVSGRVADHNSKGIAGAKVSLSSDMKDAATTDANGNFTIEIHRNTTATLYAKANGYEFASKQITIESEDITDIVFQEIYNFVDVSGRVTDNNSKGVAGAKVSLSSDMSNAVTTDADGNFTIVVGKNATATLYTKADGYDFSPKTITTKADNITGIAIQGNVKTVTISGKVLDANAKPLSGIFITNENKKPEETLIIDHDSDNPKYYYHSSTRTISVEIAKSYVTKIELGISYLGNPGELKISILDASNNTLWQKTVTPDDNYFSQRQLKPLEVDLSLTPNAKYTIKTENTKAYSTTDYYAYYSTDNVMHHKVYAIDAIAVTNANGEYSVTAARNSSLSLYAWTNYDLAPLTFSNISSDLPNQDFKPAEEQKPRTYTISGKVTDEKSKAISGATVTLAPTAGAQQTKTTDRNGAYSFTVNDGFAGTITAQYDGYTFAIANIAKVSSNIANQNFKGEKIIVYAYINGVVSDQNGNPLRGAKVSINADMTDAVTTDGNGAYSIQVDNNFSGKIYAQIDGYETSPVTIKNATGTLRNQNITAKEIIDEKSTVYISGRVFDKQYNPVEGAEVYTTTDGVPELKLDIEKSDDAGNCYYLPNADYASNYSYSAFTAKSAKIGRVEFKVFYGGKPGKVTVAILDANKSVVAEKSIEQKNVKNDDWTAVDIDAKLTPGSQYFIVLKASQANTSGTYYAYYDSKDDDGMLFRTYAYNGGETKNTVKTSFDGSYVFEVNVGENVKLYASYANLSYEAKTYQQLRYDIPSQDFVPDGAVAPANTVTVSGTVYDFRHKAIAGAIVTSSSKTPYILSSQEDCTTCNAFNEHDVMFKATDHFVSQIDFMISKTGTPGSLKVSILNAAKLELWSKTFTNDETTAWQWKEVFIDNSLAITPGENYYVRLTAENKNGGYYYYVMNDKYDMAYRVWANDAPSVMSDSKGAYTFTVNAKTSGSIHAYYEDYTFNTVTYDNLTKNVTGYDFGIFTSAGNLREKNVATPVSEITPGTKTNSALPAAKVWSYDKVIVIEALAGTRYSIIDANGRLIKEDITQSTHDEITLSIVHDAILVVRIGGQSFKVMY